MLTYPKSLNLTLPNTPITKINRIKNTQLWIKRDDVTGIELSGNKIRKLDFLIQEAIDKKATGIITCGGLQSNHCRAAAFAAAKVGLDSILYLRGVPENDPGGNHFLNLLVGAKIEYVTAEEYEEIDSIMIEKSRQMEADGQKYYVIPEGGSNEVGAWGYIKCFGEILEQIEKDNLSIEAIAVATGSGGTHAGLYIGKLLNNSNIDVFSINVCDDADFFRTKIAGIINSFEKRYGNKFEFDSDDIVIYDGYVGDGYGVIGQQEVSLIKEFARKEGIVLDPVYTAKAFLGLTSIIESQQVDYKNILFIHTGGIFGIFPMAEKFI